MTLITPPQIKAVPAGSDQKTSDPEYERQLAWLRDAIEEGWQAARAGKLTSAEDFEIEFAEFERQWLAEQNPGPQHEKLPAH